MRTHASRTIPSGVVETSQRTMTRRRIAISCVGAMSMICLSQLVCCVNLGPRSSAVRMPAVIRRPRLASVSAEDRAIAPASIDPSQLIASALERCRREVDRYRCTFWRVERLGGKLTEPQTMDVYYQESPRTVDMRWHQSNSRIKRALYVEGRNLGPNGEPRALVQPSGFLGGFCPDGVAIPIHGSLARESSRHSMDDFGFRETLERIRLVNALASERGVLDFRYVGAGEVDGRPTHVLVRNLPYSSDPSVFPDALLVLHIDREWLLPVAVHSYADKDQKVLLGSYVVTDVRINPDDPKTASRF